MLNGAIATVTDKTRRTSSTVALSAGSILTGAGTVMLGVVLPTLSMQWGLRDDQAGLLLFLQFVGSSLGALVVGLNRIRSMAIGYGLMTVALTALALGGPRSAYFAFLFYGLGLGTAMTSTSLLFSDRWGDDRAAKLEWLNFVWSAGASAGPVCFLPFLNRGDTRSVFTMMLVLSLTMFAWVILRERHEPRLAPRLRPSTDRRSIRKLFFLLLLLAMAAVGVEATLSGWLTTYSQRAGMHSVAGAALATSILWLGEMVSRLTFSTRLLAKVGRRAVLQWGIWGVTIASILVIAAPHPWLILVAAGAVGIFIGPIYPLTLSYLLELSPWGWFFAVGGLGSALFPWITGLVSAHYHSLRYGLVVPCATGLAMIGLSALVSGQARNEAAVSK
jgi:FHS family glucose/mannose:H+ symporter-like MFS transporter